MNTSCIPANPPVTFDPAEFKASFPVFAGCTDAQLATYFRIAGLYCWNSTQNPAFPSGNLALLLDLATAHVAWLNAPRDAQGNPSAAGAPPSPIVGRINSASEGSVSVGAEWTGSGSPSEAWWIQTQYGAMWWQATAQYRTARYLPNPTIVPGTLPPYGGAYLGFRRRW